VFPLSCINLSTLTFSGQGLRAPVLPVTPKPPNHHFISSSESDSYCPSAQKEKYDWTEAYFGNTRPHSKYSITAKTMADPEGMRVRETDALSSIIQPTPTSSKRTRWISYYSFPVKTRKMDLNRGITTKMRRNLLREGNDSSGNCELEAEINSCTAGRKMKGKVGWCVYLVSSLWTGEILTVTYHGEKEGKVTPELLWEMG